MQKYLLGFIFGLLPVLAFAGLPPLTQDPLSTNPAAAIINNAPPAVQQYQSVDDPTPVQPQTSPAATPVKVTPKKTVTAAPNKQLQTQQAQLSAAVQDVNSRLTQFTQSYLLAQQESKQELALLEQKTVALQAEVEQLMTVLKAMSQQVEQLTAQSGSYEKRLMQLADSSFFQNLLAKLNGYLGNSNNSLLLLAVLVLLIFLWLLLRLNKKRARVKMMEQAQDVQHQEDDTKNEYDFMGSSEGVPAQLDLARAYIAMENYKAAEGVLKQVIAKGDESQKKQAHDLLDKLPK